MNASAKGDAGPAMTLDAAQSERAALLGNHSAEWRTAGGDQAGAAQATDGDESDDDDHYTIAESGMTTSGWMRTLLILLPLTAVVGAIAVVAWAAIENKEPDNDQRFEQAVTGTAVFSHLEAFQLIAKRDPFGSRSILNGYTASAEYVEGQLNTSRYFRLSRQYFTAPVWEQDEPMDLEIGLDGEGGEWVTVPTTIPLNGNEDAEACALRYSGTTETPQSTSVVFIADGGCNREAFTDASGKALLVLSNFTEGCTYFDVAQAAQEAGALALFVARHVSGLPLPTSRVRDADWSPDSFQVTIPCVGLSYTIGELLRTKPNAVVRFAVAATLDLAETFNVIAEVAGGQRGGEVVVVGAHLDSVPEGPGINDNGSGSACVLEMAKQFASLGLTPKRTTQFIFWGAEEVGLLGSRFYVRNLTAAELSNISANLNFDMLGSPNYVRMVYDSAGCPEGSQASCALIQNFFTDYFTNNNLDFETVPMSTTGGSDYFPFVRAGVPAGSIATGAGGIKTDGQRTRFGGLTRARYDPCYHQACDTTENVDRGVLGDMSAAAAYAVIHTIEYDGNLR